MYLPWSFSTEMTWPLNARAHPGYLACSPYVFVLATTSSDTGPPVYVYAVLKATNEVVHSFVVTQPFTGTAVVP